MPTSSVGRKCKCPFPAEIWLPSQALALLGLVVFAVLKRVEIHEFPQKIKRSFHANGLFAQDDFIAALFDLQFLLLKRNFFGRYTD